MNDTNNINQQIAEQSHCQSHSQNVKRASVAIRGQEDRNRNMKVIEVIEFIAQTMETLTNFGEK